jgi:hypothetical protein
VAFGESCAAAACCGPYVCANAVSTNVCSESFPPPDGGGDECRGSLADVDHGCAATFDGTPAQLPACPFPAGVQEVWICADETVLLYSSGYVGWKCYYDPVTHDLVGAIAFSDTNEFCQGTSFNMLGGQIPVSACSAGAPTFQHACPPNDAGAD